MVSLAMLIFVSSALTATIVASTIFASTHESLTGSVGGLSMTICVKRSRNDCRRFANRLLEINSIGLGGIVPQVITLRFGAPSTW